MKNKKSIKKRKKEPFHEYLKNQKRLINWEE